MDIDDPIQPIDARADASRYANVRAARRRSAWGALLTLAHPLVAMAGGLVLGSWHADAPATGAIGMLIAWAAARGVLFAAGAVALLFEAPSLVRRVFGRVEDARREPGLLERSARPVFVIHVLAFGAFSMTVALVAAFVGDGPLHPADVLAFGALGLGLGWSTAWTEVA